MSVGKFVSRFGVAAAVVAAIAVPQAGVAGAETNNELVVGGVVQPLGWPANCHTEITHYTTVAAICTNSNGGKWQAIAICFSKELNRTTYRYGNWVNRYASFAYCHGEERVTSTGINSSPDPL